MPKRKREPPVDSIAAVEDEPLWTHKHPETKLVSSTDALRAAAAARLNAMNLQMALKNSEQTMAVSYSRCHEMDNSTCWVPGASNPIRLWAELKSSGNNEWEDLKTVLAVLAETGASKFLNQIDSNDGNAQSTPRGSTK